MFTYLHMHMSGGFFYYQTPLIPYIFFFLFLFLSFDSFHTPSCSCFFSRVEKSKHLSLGNHRDDTLGYSYLISLEPRDLFFDWTLFGVSVRPISLPPHTYSILL